MVKDSEEATGKNDNGLYDKFHYQTYKAEVNKVKDLKWERRKSEVDLFLLSRELLTKDIKDMWTDDTMEYYLERCDEIRSDEINGHGSVLINMTDSNKKDSGTGFRKCNKVYIIDRGLRLYCHAYIWKLDSSMDSGMVETDRASDAGSGLRNCSTVYIIDKGFGLDCF
nr:hypothetical protein [Tanacetum cinerariifolium]